MEQAVLETAVLNRFLNTDIAEIRIFSRDEKKQDDMRHDYQVRYPDVAHKIKFYIGDVRSLESVRGAMLGTDYIFHAAALKQVPSCEFFLDEDVVVAFGMDLKDLEVIDDYYCVKYIIAVPWRKDKTMPWIERWNAEEITGAKRDSGKTGVSEIVKVAMKELSSIINMSTGISHPSDNDRAKTYIRALYKYESELNAHSVVSYLVAELGWTSSHANDVGKLITTLNEGRYYKGGEKTGLQVYYKRWKEQAKKSV